MMRSSVLLLAVLATPAKAQIIPDDPVPGQEKSLQCLTGKIVEADPVCDDVAAVSARLPPMPSGGRKGFAAVTIGSSLIAVGGSDDEGVFIRGGVHQVEALDLNTKIWSQLPELQEPRAEFAAVAVGCIVVVLGGWNSTGDPIAAVQALDLSKDRWSWQDPDPWFLLPPMPSGCRIALAAASVENTVVAMGGATCDGDAVATVEALDMVTREWYTLPDMPGGPRRDLAAASIGTTIFALGGMATVSGIYNTGLDRVEKLEMTTKIWTKLAPMPGGGRFKLAAAAVHHAVVVIGGRKTDACCAIPTPFQCIGDESKRCDIARVEEYDITTGAWKVRPDRAAGVGSNLAAAAVGGTVVALGGAANQDTSLATVEAFCFVNPLDIPLRKDSWSEWFEWVCVVITAVCFFAALFTTMHKTAELYDLAEM